jgi:hypothetical protein
MDAAPPISDLTQVLLDLADFLREIDRPISAKEALAQAVQEWIARERERIATGATSSASSPRGRQAHSNHGEASAAPRGYQWKSLFLPDGTDLRMTCGDLACFARVSGNAIFYEGKRVSPRQFTLAVAGEGRNAWRDVWVRLPGDRSWERAQALRRRIEKRAASEPTSPLQAMERAAACMSDAMKSALVVVEKANGLAVPRYERRQDRLRRMQDVLADVCEFD